MKNKKAITYEEAIKDMTEEELERFHKERYEKFIRPLIEMNEKELEKVLGEIRPSLQADGGDVELIDVTKEGVVQVKLVGRCAGCPMSQMTLKNGIEKVLKEAVPEIKRVESV